jgi:hypothetical protein
MKRRDFLRGAGVALGLPLLDSLRPAWAAAVPARPPVRAAFLYFPNGVWEKSWVPQDVGFGYRLSPSLEPLEDVREEVLVLSGLDKPNSRRGDGHYAKTANFLTGLPVHQTTGKDLSVGGISVDQLIAERLGHLTPLPSLELGVDAVISGIDSNVGFTRLYGSYIAWRNASTPMARENDPRMAYQRLFGMSRGGGNDPAEARRREDRRNLLDLVLEDARGLRARLGRDDQFKLDEYMDSVRAVEKRIAFFSKPDPREWTPPEPGADYAPPAGAPKDHQEHVRLMLDLIVLAFRADVTRVATFMFANDVSNKNFSLLIPGVKGGHHELSHHESKKEKTEPYSLINRWHAEQFAYLTRKLREVKEGEGSLVDNVMAMCGSSLSDGNRHDPNNLPILLGGRGGGTIRPGRHLAHPKNTPLCNLYQAMLDRLGIPVDRFGDATGPLDLEERC